MAKELKITGNKKVATLMKEFNEIYPYLSIGIFPMEAKEIVKKGGTITNVDKEKTLAEIRTKKSTKEITVSGNKKVKTLEAEFEEVYGLFVQVCYTSKEGKGYYTTGSDDEKTLSKLNEEKEKAGCLKDKWY